MFLPYLQRFRKSIFIEDAGKAIVAADKSAETSRAQLAKLDAELRIPGLSKDARDRLVAQSAALRAQLRDMAGARNAKVESLTTTPVRFAYEVASARIGGAWSQGLGAGAISLTADHDARLARRRARAFDAARRRHLVGYRALAAKAHGRVGYAVNTFQFVSVARRSSASLPSFELPRALRPGDHTAMLALPGTIARMPPPTPDLPGMPTRKANSPEPS